MRQLEIVGAGAVEWREAPAPALQGDGEALVRPLAVALCDLDAVFLGGVIPIAEPFALGHECVAEVLEVGEKVISVVPGDRVVVPFQISCGTCSACKRGRTASCETVPRGSAYGMKPLGGDWGGALSDVLRVPFADAMLVPLNGNASPEDLASVADNVADGYRAVAGCTDQDVLVVGGWARSVGLYAVACATALGASRVVYADADAKRLEQAKHLGAETMAVTDWPRKLGRFPITVDASGDHAGLHAALRSTAPDGTCTSVAIYFEQETPLPLLEMYTRGCTLHTSRVHARAVIPEVLELVHAGTLDPALVTSAVVSFDDAPEALKEPPTKLVLVP